MIKSRDSARAWSDGRGSFIGVVLVALLVFGMTVGVAGAVAVRPAVTDPPAGSWTSPLAIDAAGLFSPWGGLVTDLSCPAATNCVATGTYESESHMQGFVVEEQNGTWGSPHLYDGDDFSAVSCPSVGNCAVVGSDASDGALLDEHAGVWGTPVVVSHDNFDDVSCSSAGECVAAGAVRVGPGAALVVTEHASTWGSPVGLQSGGATFAGGVASIACTGTGRCVAAGVRNMVDGSDAFVADEVSGTWGSAQFVDAPLHGIHDDPSEYVDDLETVSCSSAGNCAAGGEYGMWAKTEFPFVVTETAGTWSSATPVTTPAGGETNVSDGGYQPVTSIDCPSDGNCTAVGSYWDTSPETHVFTVSEQAGTWGLAAQALAPNLQTLGPSACGHIECVPDPIVSCPSAGNCTAVGEYVNSSEQVSGLALTETAGVWDAGVTLASGTTQYGQATAISCPSVGHCHAGGELTIDDEDDTDPYVVDEIPATPPSAPSAATAVAGDGQATVSWTAPSSTGGAPITSYTVTSTPGGKTCTWTSGPLSCTVTGLTDGTAYTFKVTAANTAGTGPASAPSNSVTPVGVPGAPTAATATAHYSSAVISWVAPTHTGGLTITGYHVTASPGGATCSTTGTTSCEVTGLTNGTSYTFTVTATNAAGTGPASAASTAVIPAVSGSYFHALSPVRVQDSRPSSQVGPYSTPWSSGTIRNVSIGGVHGVPADATAVVLNVTVADTTGSSYLTVWPAGQSRPTASNLNWTSGEVIANAVTVQLGTGGAVSVFDLSANADVMIDVAGYYDWRNAGDGFVSMSPVRVQDSRPSSQVGPYSTPWSSGTIRNVSIGGVHGVPADATAVVLNVTVADTTGSSYLTVWPAGQSRPTASNLNWTSGEVIPNAVTVQLGTGGAVSVFNLSGNAAVVIDVAGYYRHGSGELFHPLTPVRVEDSRASSHVGPYTTPWGGGVSRNVTIGGAVGVPLSAGAVVVNATVADTSRSSYLTLWPAGQAQPTASSLNWSPGEVIANAATLQPGTSGAVSVFNLSGNADVIIDVAGYFS